MKCVTGQFAPIRILLRTSTRESSPEHDSAFRYRSRTWVREFASDEKVPNAGIAQLEDAEPILLPRDIQTMLDSRIASALNGQE
jgi:hypothetical protein